MSIISKILVFLKYLSICFLFWLGFGVMYCILVVTIDNGEYENWIINVPAIFFGLLFIMYALMCTKETIPILIRYNRLKRR
jgi:hypothetical protein